MVAQTSFLILSDTRNLENGSAQSYSLCRQMPKVDVVLHCGDLTQVSRTSAYREALSIPVDAEIVGTHGLPTGSLDSGHDQYLGCESLLKAVKTTRPLLHCFGHIHEGYGSGLKHRDGGQAGDSTCSAVTFAKAGGEEERQETTVNRGASTLMINAAIMVERN